MFRQSQHSCVSAVRGVTLLQLLGGILCIGIILSVVTRVYGSARHGAPTASLAKMNHIYKAFALYRAEFGDGSVTGGLPDRDYVFSTYLGLSRRDFISPCAGQPGFTPRSQGVSYAYTWAPARIRVFESMGLSTPIFVDTDCASRLLDGKPKLGLAVLLNGTAISVEKHGDPNSLDWWAAANPPSSK